MLFHHSSRKKLAELIQKDAWPRQMAFLSIRLSDAKPCIMITSFRVFCARLGAFTISFIYLWTTVLVKPDGSAVKWMYTKKRNSKFVNWILSLQEYNFEVRHLKDQNLMTDSLAIRTKNCQNVRLRTWYLCFAKPSGCADSNWPSSSRWTVSCKNFL